jgi:hypothetical protein
MFDAKCVPVMIIEQVFEAGFHGCPQNFGLEVGAHFVLVVGVVGFNEGVSVTKAHIEVGHLVIL